ncbi:MAG: molybdopterin-guanine dinucleotide biosynthesis protein MobB [Oscillospiraceae bacterium]|nr:molybdopterin-guanine dinucleotide biosynthesis protein MobB [Oscillospiraceae bacterium]
MKVFTVVGTSGSGKTTTIEAVVAEFARRGCRIGSVKEIHYDAFEIDPNPGSNTHRHRAAGAAPVAARGARETDLLYPGKLPMQEILRHYRDCDWVALEGVDDLPVPAVICAHSEAMLEQKWRANAVCVAGRAAGQLKEYRGAPAFNALTEAAALCDYLEARTPDYLACYDPADPDVGAEIKLTIDGREIRMVPFVQKILRNAVLGVARELEGYREGAALELWTK